MKTKKPSAIVYGWHSKGEQILISDVYFEEYLMDEVIIYSLPYTNDVVGDYSKYQPDVIVSFIDKIEIPHYILSLKHIHLEELEGDNVLANIIVCQTVFRRSGQYFASRFVQYSN